MGLLALFDCGKWMAPVMEKRSRFPDTGAGFFTPIVVLNIIKVYQECTKSGFSKKRTCSDMP